VIEYLIKYIGDHKTASLELRRINAAVVIGAVFVLDDYVADDWSRLAELPQRYNRWRVTEMQIDANCANLIVIPIEVTG
jgi:hypothetical protein